MPGDVKLSHLKLLPFACRALVFLSKHKVFISMSSRVNKRPGSTDNQTTSGNIVPNNLNGSKGQRFAGGEVVSDDTERTGGSTPLGLMSEKVEMEKLSDEEKEIYFLHKEACEKGESMYQDPASGYAVFTEVFHRERGSCCGNACRHCPFNHENVPFDKRKAKFNSAFYI